MTAGQEIQTESVDGRTARALRTREAIVDACIALVEEGDLKPTAPRIAERAGVSVRSVFQHFDDLESLFAMVAERAVGQLIGLFEPIDPELPLAERVRRFASERRTVLEAMTPIRRAAAVHAPFSREIRTRLQAGHDFLRSELVRVFGPELDAAPAGEREQLLDVLDTVASWSTWETLRTVNGRRPEACEALLRRMLDMAFAGHGATSVVSVNIRATVAAALLAVTLLVGCGDDSTSGSTSDSSAPATTTTTSTSTTTTATTAPRGEGTLLTADDTVLIEPGTGGFVDVAAKDPCATLTTGAACDTNGKLAWVLRTPGDGRSPITIYLISDDEHARPVLELEPGARKEYGSVVVEPANLDGQPGDELVVGLRNAGTGALLQLEVVDGQGSVAAHVTLDRGRAVVDGTVLRTWTARYLPDDPNCCPSRFDQATVTVDGGRWRSVLERQLPAGDVPKGDFP